MKRSAYRSRTTIQSTGSLLGLVSISIVNRVIPSFYNFSLKHFDGNRVIFPRQRRNSRRWCNFCWIKRTQGLCRKESRLDLFWLQEIKFADSWTIHVTNDGRSCRCRDESSWRWTLGTVAQFGVRSLEKEETREVKSTRLASSTRDIRACLQGNEGQGEIRKERAQGREEKSERNDEAGQRLQTCSIGE